MSSESKITPPMRAPSTPISHHDPSGYVFKGRLRGRIQACGYLLRACAFVVRYRCSVAPSMESSRLTVAPSLRMRWLSPTVAPPHQMVLRLEPSSASVALWSPVMKRSAPMPAASEMFKRCSFDGPYCELRSAASRYRQYSAGLASPRLPR